ncbi:MAG: tail fiber protein [Elusimicrobia bacterium]|nr:tail fiber protein [Elusimicrobiota bacterium]
MVAIAAVSGHAAIPFAVDGTTFVVSGGSATIANSLTVGATVTAKAFVGDGSHLTGITVPSLPVGTILDYAGICLPAGFLLCNGAEKLQSEYPNLYFAIGDTWGVATSTGGYFKLPDLSRRVTIGSGGDIISAPPLGVGDAVGDKGGEEMHALTILEMPSHTHGIPGYNFPPNYGNADRGHLGGTSSYEETLPVGGGGPHNIMQPSAVVLKIIKY